MVFYLDNRGRHYWLNDIMRGHMGQIVYVNLTFNPGPEP